MVCLKMHQVRPKMRQTRVPVLFMMQPFSEKGIARRWYRVVAHRTYTSITSMKHCSLWGVGIAALVLNVPTANAAFDQASVGKYNISYSGLTALSATIDGVRENPLYDAPIDVKQIQKYDPIQKKFVTMSGAAWTTVCLDVGNPLYQGDQYFAVVANGPDMVGLNPKWGNPAAGPADLDTALNAAANIAYSFKKNVSNPTADQYKSLQLAVWETLYDYPNAIATKGFQDGKGLGFNSGRFTVSSHALLAAANTYLGYIPKDKDGNYEPVAMKFNIVVPTDANGNVRASQELFMDFGTVTPAPEPATILAGALLLLPLGVSTVRILRRQV